MGGSAVGTRHRWNTAFTWQRSPGEPRHLTPDQVDQFHTKGWVVVEDLVDAETLAELTTELDAIERQLEDLRRRLSEDPELGE